MKDIDKSLNSEKLTPIGDLSPELLKNIKRMAVLDIYKDKAKKIIVANQVDLIEYINIWLSLKKSKKTKVAYNYAINHFFKYLSSQKIHPILVDAVYIDNYILILSDIYKANSIRQMIAACSSFYTILRRYNCITSNPFIGAVLPKKEYKKSLLLDNNKTIPLMNKEEYTQILNLIFERMNIKGNRYCDNLVRLGAKKLYLAVHFMANYGLRASAVSTIKVTDERFIYTTKGNKSKNRKLKDETIHLLKNYSTIRPLKKYALRSMQDALSKIVSLLYDSNMIRYKYSCHDFRHYFANQSFSENPDIFRLKNLMDHSSLNHTEIYLREHGILMDE